MERALNKLLNTPNVKTHVPFETVNVKYKSEIADTIYHRDGRVEVIDHGHNVMLNSFLPLLTDLLVHGGNRQLKYWAIGSGESYWDTEPKHERVYVTINQPCTSSGTVMLRLAGETHSVNVEAGDSPTDVALALSNITFGANERPWSISVSDNLVTFTSNTYENLSDEHGYMDNGTGATGYITVSQGSPEIQRETPTPSETNLKNEVYRKLITENTNYPEDGIHFLTESGEISSTPTNIIEIRLTFGYNEGLIQRDGRYIETPWREFGIVGGEMANGNLNTGYFMNAKTHACIVKAVDEQGNGTMIIERKIKFTFTNADN